MTGAWWMACTEPGAMLNALSGKGEVSDRKLRLFAVACCRAIPGYLESEPDRHGLELTECDVDGLAGAEEFEHLEEDAWDIRWYRRDAWDATTRAMNSYIDSVWRTMTSTDASEGEQVRAQKQAYAGLVQLLREVFGNPFRADSLNPTWLTPTVTALARGIYDDRAFELMPVLADALEEAGCADPDILNHCRQPGEHVRGCWLLDMILGKK